MLHRVCRGAISAVVVVALAASCGNTPPSLPPSDSMDFSTPPSGTGNALVAETESTSNIDQAVAAVFWVSWAVNAALIVPRLVLAGVVTDKPTHEDGEWIWRHTFPLFSWEAALHGTLDDRLELSMHVTGLREDTNYVNDFVWFTGSHSASEGTWQIFDPGTADQPGPEGAVIQITWSRTDATHRHVAFTNVCATCPKLGDELAYALDGSIASMTIHDEKSGFWDDGSADDFSVVWHVQNGSGKMTRFSGESVCWDALDNGQVNIECPTGDWPIP